jgi:hypothetical protein
LRAPYANFFNSRKGARKGEAVGFPQFKSKKKYKVHRVQGQPNEALPQGYYRLCGGGH